jgi:Flp pilus assembly protein TadG
MSEFAICLPVLLILAIGVFEYGQMIFTSMELTSATRDGARRAAIARTETNPAQQVRQVVQSSLDRVPASAISVDVSGGWAMDSRVTVTTTMPYHLDILGMDVWNGNLRSQSVVRIG